MGAALLTQPDNAYKVLKIHECSELSQYLLQRT